MNDVKFIFFIGDTYTRDMVIKKYSATIDEMYFTVKKDNKDRDFVLQKTLNDGITLTDVKYEGLKIIERTYNLLIQPSDTDNLIPNKEYSFDIEIITTAQDNSQIKKTIVTGTLVLTDATTKYYNEGE